MVSTARRDGRAAALLLLGYLALDWASFIHPLHGLNITPWNPAPALGLVFLMRFGGGMAVPIMIAIVVAELWVRGLPISLPVTVVVAALLSASYWAIATTLARHLPEGAVFQDRRGLFIWAAIVSGGTLLTSATLVLVLAATGYVPADGVGHAVFRFWVGDGVGVLVTMPVLWMLMDDYRRHQLWRIVAHREAPLHLALAVVVLWIAFTTGDQSVYQYVYVLFVPIAWAASRHGLPGAVASAAIIQLGIIVAVKLQGIEAATLIDTQVLAGVVALFGFFIGVVVDEKQRVSNELRQTLRLAAAGEMAGALAHELNQPLTALSAYGSVCERLLERGETGQRLREALQSMIRESHRTAEVLRRLRDFFRTGTTHLEALTLNEVLEAVQGSLAARARRERVAVDIECRAVFHLLADRLQLEVVVRNLLSNALDAVAQQEHGQRRVGIVVAAEGASQVRVSIEDTGSGFDEARLARLFEGFQSSKSSGLGLGLMISRAIVEAHGGSLWAEAGDHGIVRLVLPVEEGSKHGG